MNLHSRFETSHLTKFIMGFTMLNLH